MQLPAQPTEMDLSKLLPAAQLKDSKVYTVKDDQGIYQVIKSATAMNAESIASDATRQLYYDGVISGLLARENGTLLARATFASAGGEGLEIKYESIHKGTGKQAVKYMRSLLVGATGYSFNFIPGDKQDSTGTSGNEQRRKFFNSILVTSTPGKYPLLLLIRPFFWAVRSVLFYNPLGILSRQPLGQVSPLRVALFCHRRAEICSQAVATP